MAQLEGSRLETALEEVLGRNHSYGDPDADRGELGRDLLRHGGEWIDARYLQRERELDRSLLERSAGAADPAVALQHLPRHRG